MQKVKYSPALIQSWFESQENTNGVVLDFSKENVHLQREYKTDIDETKIDVGQFERTDEGLADLLVALKATGMEVPEFDSFVAEVIGEETIVLPSEEASTVSEEIPNQEADPKDKFDQPLEPEHVVEENKTKARLLKAGKYLGYIAAGAAITLIGYQLSKVVGVESVSQAASETASKLLS